MKINAKIKWLIDEPQLGIEVDKTENVPVDIDYVESDEQQLTEWIEDELAQKYGTSFYASDDDFIIENKDELLQDISYSEFEDKTDPGYAD